MLSIRNILVATDLTDEGRWALRYGWTVAARFGARLHVFYADVLHGPLHGRDEAARSEKDSRKHLDELVKRVAERDREGTRVPTELVVERNIYPAPAILEYASTHDIDLIVMGTHGRRGVSRLVLGSVAEEVVRRANCAVLTIRVPDGEEPDHLEMSSLLVPFDFSVHSKNALAHAKELAAAFGSRIDMLHVVEERLHPAFYGIALQSIYDVDPDIETRSITHMEEAYREVGGPDVRATFEARPGSPGREIIEYAEERESSLVVMGTHGLTGLTHFLLGSVTERVLRRASCPVLALKSFGKPLLEGRAVSAEASK